MTNEIITTQGVLLDNQGIRQHAGIIVEILDDTLIVNSMQLRLADIDIDRYAKRITGSGGWEIVW